jgi:hypothetical protein
MGKKAGKVPPKEAESDSEDGFDSEDEMERLLVTQMQKEKVTLNPTLILTLTLTLNPTLNLNLTSTLIPNPLTLSLSHAQATADATNEKGSHAGEKVPQAINNKNALLKAVEGFEVNNMPFVETLAVICPAKEVDFESQDDLKREVYFYHQAVTAVKIAREDLTKNKIPYHPIPFPPLRLLITLTWGPARFIIQLEDHGYCSAQY